MKVSTGMASTSWTYMASGRPRARSRMWRATRSARPLFATATPSARTPTRKYGTGLAKPWSASRKLLDAPVSASSVTPSSAVAPESSQRVVQRTMVISVTRSARWPESERPWKSGGSTSVSPSAPMTRAGRRGWRAGERWRAVPLSSVVRGMADSPDLTLSGGLGAGECLGSGVVLPPATGSYLTKVRLHGRRSVRLPTPRAPSKRASTR